MEKRVLLKSDVDEHRLEAGNDGFNDTLVNVSERGLGIELFDEKLDECAVFENGDSNVGRLHIDENLFEHEMKRRPLGGMD